MRLRTARKIAAQKGKTLHDLRHHSGQLARAIARLRKAWRHQQPMEDGSRKTDDDFFRSNQLASRWSRLPFIEKRPMRNHPNIENFGKKRSMQ